MKMNHGTSFVEPVLRTAHSPLHRRALHERLDAMAKALQRNLGCAQGRLSDGIQCADPLPWREKVLARLTKRGHTDTQVGTRAGHCLKEVYRLVVPQLSGIITGRVVVIIIIIKDSIYKTLYNQRIRQILYIHSLIQSAP